MAERDLYGDGVIPIYRCSIVKNDSETAVRFEPMRAHLDFTLEAWDHLDKQVRRALDVGRFEPKVVE